MLIVTALTFNLQDLMILRTLLGPLRTSAPRTWCAPAATPSSKWPGAAPPSQLR